jgi:prophage regulatory protein
MSSSVPPDVSAMQSQILRREQVLALCGISNTTLHRWIKTENFPRPRQLGPRAVGWLLTECQEWLLVRPQVGSCHAAGQRRGYIAAHTSC